jgi:signal transduction histidine kinase
LAVNEGDKISCRFHCHGDPRVADSRTATQLYRIAQEALSNAIKHSNAGRIEIMLEHDETATVLRLRDDGEGLPPRERRKAGLGLQIMRYRAQLIGGTLSAEPLPAGGTEVTCRLPRKTA